MIDIGLEWKVNRTNDWMEACERLVTHNKKYKTTIVPRFCEGDPQLGIRISHQRQQCKEEDRADLLNDIGFVWDARDW